MFAKLISNKKDSVICVNGQPNLAVLLLLDLVAKSDTTIFYNGDFDPEGLLIAQKLKNRYQNKLTLWHYEEEDYHRALSQKSISEKRMKMLEQLTEPNLCKIAEWMKVDKKAGYQENIIL